MMRVPFALALALVLLSVESVLVQYTSHLLASVDVTVVIIAFLALRARMVEGAVTAFGVGYLLDVMSGRPTGLYTFLAVLAFAVGKLSSSLVVVNSPQRFGLYAVAVDAGHALVGLLVQWLVSRDPVGTETVTALPLELVLTGAVAMALYRPLKRLEPRPDEKTSDALR